MKWDNPVNWSGNTVPGYADEAVFNATSTKDVDIGIGAVVNALKILNGYTGALRTVSGSSVYVGTGGWLQQAGTFRSGTGSITVRGPLTLTGGTFVSSPNFLTVAGDFRHTGGTFTANGGTLNLASPSDRSLTTGAALDRLETESTLETGLEAYWKLDEGPIATGLPGFSVNHQRSTIRDSSGNGWDLELPSAAGSASTNWPAPSAKAAPTGFANPGSIKFTQSRSWLETRQGPYIGVTGTIAFWLQIDSLNPADYTVLFCTRVTPNGICHTNVAIYQHSFGFVVSTSDSFLSDHDWHHIAYVKDAATATSSLYIDGALIGSAASDPAAVIGYGMFMGNYSEFDLLGFFGRLDDFRMYSRALSAAEVVELAAGRYPTRTGGSKLTLGSDVTVSGALENHNGTLALGPRTLTALGAAVANYGRITQAEGKILHQAVLSATPTATIGNRLFYTLTDGDENTDGTAADAVTLTVDGETVTLTETAAASGIFAGSIATAHQAPQAGNGVLESNDRCGVLYRTTFTDAQDGGDVQTVDSEVTDPGVPCAIPGSGGGGARLPARRPGTPGPAPVTSSAAGSPVSVVQSRTTRTVRALAVALRAAPGGGARTITRLRRGQEVIVVGTTRRWAEVRLRDGTQGFVLLRTIGQ